MTTEYNFHDNREHFNIVFIGHVDAGKSTTCGHILLLTGKTDERTICKYKEMAKERNRESWWIAYIMDTSEDERNKGKTVEVGMADFETKKRRYSILDAPGHKNYVPAMISGAAQADIGILVISARKGEYEAGFQRGGQTREHALLAKTLGIGKLVIAVNKMDDETVNWSKERYDFIIEKTTVFLKQCGFREKDISNLPMSGLTGDGIINPPSEKICDWSEGKTLLSLLDNQKITRPKNSAVRLPVISRYNEMGTVVALGKIESGVLLAGAKLKLSPSGKEVVCDSIFVSEEKVDAARSGENVNVYLKNCEKEDIFCGDIICGIDDIAPKSNFLECQIYVTDLLKHKPVISVGYSCIFHAHSTTSQCEFLRLGQIDKNKKMKKIQFAKEKSAIFCKLKLSKQIAIEKYSDFAQLGRFTLRDEGKTIAIGRVLKLLE